jgi:hypothetical protein
LLWSGPVAQSDPANQGPEEVEHRRCAFGEAFTCTEETRGSRVQFPAGPPINSWKEVTPVTVQIRPVCSCPAYLTMQIPKLERYIKEPDQSGRTMYRSSQCSLRQFRNLHVTIQGLSSCIGVAIQLAFFNDICKPHLGSRLDKPFINSSAERAKHILQTSLKAKA